MNNWWKNEELKNVELACDEAIKTGERTKINEMSRNCIDLGENANLPNAVRARYLYCSATCLMSMIGLSSDSRKKERLEEKCLYLFRTAIDFIKQDLDCEYTLNFYCYLVVNYSNFLTTLGRLVKSINVLNEVKELNFPMATGNFALKIDNYSCFSSSRKFMQYFSFQLLTTVLGEKVIYPEREEANKSFLACSKRIEENLGKEYLNSDDWLSHFSKTYDNACDDEIAYRHWIGEKGLALHHLNDILDDISIANDPLYFPSLNENIDSNLIPSFLGMFNQIKQEYVSARFWIYDGLNNRNAHYSDREVYMPNTLDYPVYGLGIEQIKSAYRNIYSMFDNIAFFLNKYLELNIDDTEASFNKLWEKNRTTTEALKKDNFAFNGLWWIYKDLRNNTVYDDKHIDPLMSKISVVRNAMEHRYLKILDYFDESVRDEVNSLDELAENIGFDDFEMLTMGLLRLAREAIIHVSMIVQIEEDKKDKDPKTLTVAVCTGNYEDEWKRIG